MDINQLFNIYLILQQIDVYLRTYHHQREEVMQYVYCRRERKWFDSHMKFQILNHCIICRSLDQDQVHVSAYTDLYTSTTAYEYLSLLEVHKCMKKEKHAYRSISVVFQFLFIALILSIVCYHLCHSIRFSSH